VHILADNNFALFLHGLIQLAFLLGQLDMLDAHVPGREGHEGSALVLLGLGASHGQVTHQVLHSPARVHTGLIKLQSVDNPSYWYMTSATECLYYYYYFVL